MSNFFNYVPLQEKVIFAKRLAFLIKAGMPISQSVGILRDQAKSAVTRKVLDQVLVDVSSGRSLSYSLAKFNYMFDEFAVNIIRVGEESGTLDQNLDYLADELKKKQVLRKKIWGAMIYPLFIVGATFGITGLLTLYIFPKILPIFKSLNVRLPLTTRALIFINDFITRYGTYLVIIFLIAVVAAIILTRKKSVRYAVERVILNTPLLGSISQSYTLANTCRTIGILLKGNIRIMKAFSITSEATGNLVYKRELDLIATDINKGEKLASSLQKKPRLFPRILSELVTTGELTGNLSETMIYLSELYESEVDDLTKTLSTVIEPTLMIFMGVIVGFIAVSIITPIYEVTQYLHP